MRFRKELRCVLFSIVGEKKFYSSCALYFFKPNWYKMMKLLLVALFTFFLLLSSSIVSFLKDLS